jgi:hypothetical protein
MNTVRPELVERLCFERFSTNGFTDKAGRINKGTKVRCKTTDWAAYNAALKARELLTIWLDEGMPWYAPVSGERRRQTVFSDTAIPLCLSIKCF